jgi:hypothetical protein
VILTTFSAIELQSDFQVAVLDLDGMVATQAFEVGGVKDVPFGFSFFRVNVE